MHVYVLCWRLRLLLLTVVYTVITLARRCIIAVDERDIQIKAFKRVNKTVKDDDRRKWSAAISDWEEDRSMPSPYGLPQRSK